MTSAAELRLPEWSGAGPDDHPALADHALAPAVRTVCEALAHAGRLEVLELRRGVRIATTSWVGRLDLGGLTLTVEPKVRGAPLAALLRYAYGLRDLRLFDDAEHDVAADGLQDLLVHQLLAEARELVAAGLHRDYVDRREALSSPRGRIEFARAADTIGRARAVLPCLHRMRSPANPLNAALASTLELAARLVGAPAARHQAWHLARLVSPEPCGEPTHHSLDAAEAKVDRRTRAYLPALRLARLLVEGNGLSLDDGRAVALPGVLFDMNAFFQALVSRFLADNLPGHRVETERVLRDMYVWEEGGNPLRRRAPRPRPDLLVMDGRRIAAVLDAKYRDLWEHPLPRDMLYQLTLYALGHGGGVREAAIVYPTLAEGASVQAVALRDPRSGATTARVTLRPLDLRRMAAITGPLERHGRASERLALARGLAVGE